MPRAKQPNPANNRHDLLTPAAPGRNMTTPDQEYGKRTAQEQSQQILPVGPNQTSVATPAPGTSAGPTPGGGAQAPAPQPQAGLPRLEPGQFSQSLSPQHEAAAAAIGQQAQAVAATGEQATLKTVLAHLASQPNASSVVRSLASAASQ